MDLLGKRKTKEQKQESKTPEDSKCASGDAGPNQPMYSDLGKRVKKLFTQGFGYGSIAVNYKVAEVCSGVELGTKVKYVHDTSEVFGQISYKILVCSEPDITLSAKTYQDQKVTVGVNCNKLIEGLKLAADVDLLPTISQSELHAKTTFQSRHCTARAGCDFTGTHFSDTAFNSFIVAGRKSYSAGLSLGYDLSGGRLSSCDLAVARGWKGLDMVMSLKGFMSEFNCMVRADYSDNVEVGAEVVAKRGTSRNSIGIVAAYNYASPTKYYNEIVLKGKVNTDLDIGLSAKTKITENMFLTVSAMIHGHDLLNYRCHKWGISVRF